LSSTLAKIAEIEAEMAWTQKNKATAHHLGLLKARKRALLSFVEISLPQKIQRCQDPAPGSSRYH
uniref:Uncharacterized protein n=2 Tax=Canis lupus familiaris TaxID=9615 RepID=A0A8C0NCD3_CANLF